MSAAELQPVLAENDATELRERRDARLVRQIVLAVLHHADAQRCALIGNDRAQHQLNRRILQHFLLAPRALYEQVGDVPNVVFPCAALVDHDSDRVSVYYGGADTVVCLAHGHLSELLAFVRS